MGSRPRWPAHESSLFPTLELCGDKRALGSVGIAQPMGLCKCAVHVFVFPTPEPRGDKRAKVSRAHANGNDP